MTPERGAGLRTARGEAGGLRADRGLTKAEPMGEGNPLVSVPDPPLSLPSSQPRGRRWSWPRPGAARWDGTQRPPNPHRTPAALPLVTVVGSQGNPYAFRR